MLGDLRSTLGGDLLYADRIQHLREVRNLVQHRGEIPDRTTSARAADDVQDFATALCERTWGVAFRTLSRTAGIDDERLRLLMEHSERSLRSGGRDDALPALAHAYDRLRALARDQPAWLGRRWANELPRSFGLSFGSAGYSRVRDFGEAMDDLSGQLATVRAGLAGADYEWFRRTIPQVRHIGAGTLLSFPEPGPSAAELERAHEFAPRLDPRLTP